MAPSAVRPLPSQAAPTPPPAPVRRWWQIWARPCQHDWIRAGFGVHEVNGEDWRVDQYECRHCKDTMEHIVERLDE